MTSNILRIVAVSLSFHAVSFGQGSISPKVTNPPKSVGICEECPPPFIFQPYGGFDGFPNVRLPQESTPGALPTGMQQPDSTINNPPGAGQCNCAICWVIEELLDKEGQHYDATRQKIVCAQGCADGGTYGGGTPSSDCETFELPGCPDVDSDQVCDVVDDGSGPRGDGGDTNDADPHDTYGDDVYFGDSDRDNLPNFLDLFPTGGSNGQPGGPPNWGAHLPTDPGLIENLFSEWEGGSSAGSFAELFRDIFIQGGLPLDMDGNGFVTLADIVGGFNLYMSASGQTFQAALGSLRPGEDWNSFILTVRDAIEYGNSLNENVAALMAFYEAIGPSLFGGNGASLQAALSALDEWRDNIEEILFQLQQEVLPAAIVQASILPGGGYSLSAIVQIYSDLIASLGSALITNAEGTPLIAVGLANALGIAVPANQGDTPEVPPSAQSKVKDPVNSWSGEFTYTVRDFSIAGRGIDFSLERHYRSRATGTSFFGRNWSSIFDSHISIYQGANGLLELRHEDGSYSYFRRVGDSPLYEGIAGEFGKIVRYSAQFPEESGCNDSPEGFVYRSPQGMLQYFCPPSAYAGVPGVLISWLRKVSDASGNAIVIQRNPFGQPVRVVDSLQRVFSIVCDRQNHLIRSIVDPAGRRWDYSYDMSEYKPGTSASGTGPFSHVAGLTRPSVSRNLLRVDFPVTEYLDPTLTVAQARPFERYEYYESAQGYERDPSPFSNHNLKTICNDPGGKARIEIAYYDILNGDLFDRVSQYTVDGKVTRFTYKMRPEGQSTLDPGNPYGQTIERIATLRTHEGEVERFYHDSQGRLVRSEILEAKDADGDFLPETSGEIWTKLYRYGGEDFLLQEQAETTPSGYPLDKVRRTTFLYDLANSDRFAQANVLELCRYADPSSGAPLVLRTRIEYDPLIASPRQITDPLGRISRVVYAHQERSYAQVRDDLQVRSWKILPLLPASPESWGLGDRNGDGILGGSYLPILAIDPAVAVASASGPGTTSEISPRKTRRYNEFGQEVWREEASGIRTATEYRDGHPRIQTVNPETLALSTIWSYDAISRVTSMVTPDQQRVETHYDARDLPVEVRKCATAQGAPSIVNQAFFDLQGRPLGSVPAFFANPSSASHYLPGYRPPLESLASFDGAGNRIRERRFLRDESGSVLEEGIWTYEYDSEGQLVQETRPSGSRIRIFRDPRGLEIERKRLGPDGQIFGASLQGFNEYGEILSRTSPADPDRDGSFDAESFVVDGFGRTIESRSPLGVRSLLAYDEANRVVREELRSSRGNLLHWSKYDYDGGDRLLRKTTAPMALGSEHAMPLPLREESFGYSVASASPLWTHVESEGQSRIERFRYDELGRLTGRDAGADGETGESFVLDAAGRVIERRARYDNAGNLAATNPSETSQCYGYDPLGRLQEIRDAVGASWKLRHDARGNLTEALDPAQNRTLLHYDFLGRKIATLQFGSAGEKLLETRRFFDIEDRMREIVDGENRRTAFDYDAMGRLSVKRFADASEESFLYDAKDRVTSIVKPGSVRHQLEYDAADRVRYLVATGAQAPVRQSFFYDDLGNAVRAEDRAGDGPVVTVTRRYASSGELLEESQQIGALASRSFRMEYDGLGSLRLQRYPSGFSVSYLRDSLGRVERIQSPNAGEIAAYSQPYGTLRRTANLADGARVERDFDGRGLLKRVETRTASNAVLAGGAFEYDLAGNLRARARGADGMREEFSYDGLHRIRRWVRDARGSFGAPRQVEWAYDRSDNVVAKTDTSNPALHPLVNSLNQYTGFSPLLSNIRYSACGEQLQQTNASGESRGLRWDAVGRVLSAEQRNASGSIFTERYRHDAFGRLVERESANGMHTRYGYVGSDQLESEDSIAGLREYVLGDDARVLFRFRNGTEKRYFHLDPFANVEALHDGSAVHARYGYEPFGRALDPATGAPLATPQASNDLMFLARPQDLRTGLVHLGARALDPLLERFVSRDPLGEYGGLNLYDYGFRNPFRWADPSGLIAENPQVQPTPGASRHGDEFVFGNSLEDLMNGMIASDPAMQKLAGGTAPYATLERGKQLTLLFAAYLENEAALEETGSLGYMALDPDGEVRRALETTNDAIEEIFAGYAPTSRHWQDKWGWAFRSSWRIVGPAAKELAIDAATGPAFKTAGFFLPIFLVRVKAAAGFFQGQLPKWINNNTIVLIREHSYASKHLVTMKRNFQKMDTVDFLDWLDTHKPLSPGTRYITTLGELRKKGIVVDVIAGEKFDDQYLGIIEWGGELAKIARLLD